LNVDGGTVMTEGMVIGEAFLSNAGTNAQVVISGSGSVTVKNFMHVGAGDQTSGGGEGILTVKDNGTFTFGGGGAVDFVVFGRNAYNAGNSGTLNLQGDAVFHSAAPVRFGWVEEGKGFLNVSDNAQLIVDSGELSPAALMFGDFNNSPIGTGANRPIGIATQTGGTVSIGADAARPQWTAIGGSGRGEYYLSGGTLNIWVRDGLNIGDADQNGFAGEGLFEMSGGTLNATEVSVGKAGRATGTFNQSGGTVNVGIDTPDGNFVDRIDTMGVQTALDDNYDGKLSLGSGFGAASTSSGTYNISNGTLHARGINVGFLAEGTLTQTGGTVIADVGVIVAFGANDAMVPSTGTLNLDGGVIETAAIGGGGGGNSTVNFNGGVVRATVDQPQFLVNMTTANVAAGGLKVDSNGFDVGSDQAFSGVGGLTKQGAGRLVLSGNSTYAGASTVQAGTLVVNGAHTGGGAFTVDAGATLDGAGSIGSAVNVNGTLAAGDGIGALTVSGNVTFAAGSTFAVEIDAGGGADLLNVANLDLSTLTDSLSVSLIGSPAAGPYLIANYSGSLTGTFDSVTPGVTVDYSQPNQIFVTLASGGLPGDFNMDNQVDGLDFLTWQRGFPGAYDAADLADWQSNYGAGVGPAVGAAVAVPEPAATMLAVVALAALGGARRTRETS
ncbi:MAG: autotransporter-associated beta strand repeat-containing protein, partial [Planctomycetales bacterium]|nr:autotransporter-associated beta strand repeat-containing protein [Planctomycetales bacterium]